MSSKTTKITWITAAALVISNMVGTGVFTSLGFQLDVVQNTWSIITLWLIGGLMALFGAFSYAQLATHFKLNGGEYIYLSRVFHPVLGYLAGWASIVVGFSAPIAISAIAMTEYLQPFGIAHGKYWAALVIVFVGLVHSFSVKQSTIFQNLSSALKILFLLALIGIGFYYTAPAENALWIEAPFGKELLSSGFAVSLIYVSYAYIGWNAAAYIAGDIKDIKTSIPKALLVSTVVVTVLYLGMQLVLLKWGTLEQLRGEVQVANIAFGNIFDDGRWISFFIALQLVATISAYVWIGPRVLQAMSYEHNFWKYFKTNNANGIPVRAVWLFVLIAVVPTLTGSFEQITLFTGFVLQLITTLVVFAVLFLPKNKSSFKSPLYPIPQIVFIGFSLWILIHMLIEQPVESFIGLGIIAVGLLTYRGKW